MSFHGVTVGALVVYFVEGMVPLLAGCVPDIKGRLVPAAKGHGLGEHARVDRADLFLIEVASAEAKGQRGLPHTG